MKRSILFVPSLIAILAASSVVQANSLETTQWSEELKYDMSAMKQEAIVSINQENAKAIEERDAKLVKHIKEEQEQLVHIKCQKVDQTKS
ncbi:TPA: hypothetical protein RQJ75_000479 [Vibrio vulnificus]|uniref:Methyl-accepting chemotaxis protein n=2 Tax=Vibrio vulnificus TaxID=672 RepID=A0A3Q0KZA4_VIBVU|nr:hypothetical protein [Vibrio vulnificus]AAO07842.1 Methyl-accepting chemotaxis protein [Vibrio vulnificus CMCP6]ALM73750.1 hypothetical protein FORC9_4233 [Vibrio vulnificus]ANN29397.1 chemotaxis protein [Vibrio vulnificus]ARN68812.1 hypothetical protein FORC36_4295 [Vibrio vulnificus]EGQ9831957.1 hypothetical protein [Vibrio vulnificus]